jgi:hypothetical protein
MCLRRVVALLFAILAVEVTSPCRGQDLTVELGRLDRLRNGLKTPLDEVDRRGEELLKKYSNPRDRGRIYYQLAHVHAQSGVRRPEQVIAYAEAALQCPLGLSQQLRLYTYWGDALGVSKEKKPFAARRTEAAAIYLKGLREVSALKLPEKPPEPEPMTFFNGPDAEENRRKGQEQWVRRRQIDYQREMIKHRDVLQGQIVSLYGRRPVATEELRDTATKILGEGKALDRLMAAVEAKVAKLPPEDKNSRTAAMTPAKPRSPHSKFRTLGLLIGSGVALVFTLVLLFWRTHRTRQEGAGSPSNIG